MRNWKMIGVAAVIVIAGATAAFAYAPAAGDITTVSPQTAIVSHAGGNADRVSRFTAIRLADGHADVCRNNYDQCVKACDGATSCANQCQTNYDGCMKNGQ